MAVVSGKAGDITFASGYVAHCSSWTIDIAQDFFEDTELGDTYRTKIPGLIGWSGSFSCKLDSASLTGTSVSALGMNAAAAAATFTYDTSDTIAGTIIITGASVVASIDGANSVEFTFEGSGGLTFATA
jgi:hypothetical protein